MGLGEIWALFISQLQTVCLCQGHSALTPSPGTRHWGGRDVHIVPDVSVHSSWQTGKAMLQRCKFTVAGKEEVQPQPWRTMEKEEAGKEKARCTALS